MSDKRFSLAELKRRLAEEGLTAELRALLEADERAGAAAMLKSAVVRAEKERQAILHSESLLVNERRLWDAGYKAIAGIDEVGRGPLAGPLTVGLVILPPRLVIPGVDDSKKLTPEKREELAPIIREKALYWTTESIPPEEIDTIGIYRAVVKAMSTVIERAYGNGADYALVDAMRLNKLPVPIESIIHGDGLSQTIGAASIIAKVERDTYMTELDKVYPEYGFAGNKGYGSPAHIEAIRRYGLSPVHRRSFCGSFV